MSLNNIIMENHSRNILKFVICFHFQVMPLYDYVTLHNLRVPLTYIVTHNEATRDVVMIGDVCYNKIIILVSGIATSLQQHACLLDQLLCWT